ncbi:acetate uptake transporter [Luteimicrobium sp. NPDC057192]|uniref:acetate uptake transporter n=1 Tax=Luteimicrobium sp. NPDC057192 TaxID=3346042 RepID=UPI0036286EEA
MSAANPARDVETNAEAGPLPRGAAAFADPAPLGLAAFALTTFVLSFTNTGLFKAEPVVFGLALAYGGIAQMLAGMWEFAKGNTFGATAFTSYGAFWIAFWYLTGHTDLSGVDPKDAGHGVGLFLLAWAIFTAYMFIASLRTTGALVGVFGLLTVTFLLLALGDLTDTSGLAKAGGWFGVATALVAWYASFAGVLAFTNKRAVLPVGPR